MEWVHNWFAVRKTKYGIVFVVIISKVNSMKHLLSSLFACIRYHNKYSFVDMSTLTYSFHFMGRFAYFFFSLLQFRMFIRFSILTHIERPTTLSKWFIHSYETRYISHNIWKKPQQQHHQLAWRYIVQLEHFETARALASIWWIDCFVLLSLCVKWMELTNNTNHFKVFI